MNTPALQFLVDARTPAGIQLPPIITICGEEEFLRREALAAVVATLNRTLKEPDISRFDNDTPAVQVFDELHARSLFGGRRIVILYNMKVGREQPFLEANNDRLTEYCAAPSKVAVLIVVSEKISKVFRVAKALDKHLWIDCDPPKGAVLLGWAAAQARHAGFSLSNDDVEYLLECVGNSMGAVVNEVEKIRLFLGLTPEPGKPLVPIGRDVLQRLLGFQGTATTFQLLDHLTAGNLRDSLTDADVLLRQGEHPLAMIGLVGWQLKIFWKVAGRIAGGASIKDALYAAKVPPFKHGQMAAAMKGISLETCRAMLAELALADRKDSLIDPELAFELFIMRLCTRLKK